VVTAGIFANSVKPFREPAFVFLSSSVYLIFMLVGAAAAVYPNLLVSTTDPALNITVYNAATGHYSLSVGLIMWGIGMALAIGYFVFIIECFAAKFRWRPRDMPIECGVPAASARAGLW
jgi:cytochrome bd ubiquinol oxidase subunit II